MANSIRYFVGNWKMFGVPSSYSIIEKFECYFRKIKKTTKNIKL